MFRLMGIYATLAAMSLAELEDLQLGLQIRAVVDPWATGALKLVAHEILAEKRAIANRNELPKRARPRNKIITFWFRLNTGRRECRFLHHGRNWNND